MREQTPVIHNHADNFNHTFNKEGINNKTHLMLITCEV